MLETPDAATIIFHLSQPYASFTVNLIPSAIGIVPANAGADFSRHPIGSGPFRFVQQSQDEEVLVERNPDYFRGAPQLARVRFRVVPDAVVRALELRKGSADLEMSSLSPDIIPVLARRPELAITERSGTNLTYLSFNLEDPALANANFARRSSHRSRRGFTIFSTARRSPPVCSRHHWAAEPASPYPYDPSSRRTTFTPGLAANKRRAPPSHAEMLHRRSPHRCGSSGTMAPRRHRARTSPLELATLSPMLPEEIFRLATSDGGANTDPDFHTFFLQAIPPDGANCGHYRNPRLDALTDQIRMEMNQENESPCSEAQKILAEDLPYLTLWFNDVVSAHRRSMGELPLPPRQFPNALPAVGGSPQPSHFALYFRNRWRPPATSNYRH